MTRHTQHLTSIAVLAAAVMALSSCNSPAAEPSDNTSSATSVPPTATASASTTKTESVAEQAAREAREAVPAYWGKIDQLASDPNTSLSGLAEVADGQALTQWQRTLTLMRGDGVKQVGSVKVEDVHATPGKESGTYKVDACVDVSKVNVIDKDGKSVISADRQPRTRYTYQVQKINGTYYITEDSFKGKPC